ncbi:MAG: tRNA dihydrouridine synthase DusB [Phycisphaerales bacterium]|nr:tRNA dihydrouridine synthase DusB [Phycisphaerales bacterium]
MIGVAGSLHGIAAGAYTSAMLRIGPFQTDCRVLLAPIAGYTDLAFRLTCRAAGHGGLTYTELLHSRGILEQNRDSLEIARVSAEDEPYGVQLYGNDADWFCQAAQWAQSQGATLIDINMGCPVDKVTKTNGGSMLLCDPDRTTRMAERIVRSVSIPVTAKLRLGWSACEITAPRLARQLEDVGIQLMTIHGRTTAQRFKGTASLDGIAEVVAAVRQVRVIGNGDVDSAAAAARMIEHTRCAGVMVARAAIKRPWVLREIHEMLTLGRSPAEPTVLEKIRLIRRHFDLMRRYRGDRLAIIVMRGRIAAYGTSLGHVKPFKERIRLMNSASEFDAAMDELESRVDPAWTMVPHWAFIEHLGTTQPDEVADREAVIPT